MFKTNLPTALPVSPVNSAPVDRGLIEDLLDALCTALPYVEDSLDSGDFKTGVVQKAIIKINGAIDSATKSLGESK